MSKIGIIGHFGIGKKLLNGQTIKTKIITDELKKQYHNDVEIVDTHGGIRKIIKIIINTISLIKHCDNVIIMTTENGLKVLVPILYHYNKKYKKRLHYIVIGGWLEKFLKSHKSVLKKLKKFDYIYVETNIMKNQLLNLEFDNVLVMPNCKALTIVNIRSNNYFDKEPYKLCTFSRVMKEKGIEDAINVVERINKKFKKTVFKLDIYGQIDSNQTEWFDNLKKNFQSYICYKGVIDFDKTTQVLKDYFLLLFPTRFFTEGIPGTIIDGYASGLPVVSSRWESFSDVVDDGVTGFGYEFKNNNELYELLIRIMKDSSIITKLKKNCLKKAKMYTVDEALKVLYRNIR